MVLHGHSRPRRIAAHRARADGTCLPSRIGGRVTRPNRSPGQRRPTVPPSHPVFRGWSTSLPTWLFVSGKKGGSADSRNYVWATLMFVAWEWEGHPIRHARARPHTDAPTDLDVHAGQLLISSPDIRSAGAALFFADLSGRCRQGGECHPDRWSTASSPQRAVSHLSARPRPGSPHGHSPAVAGARAPSLGPLGLTTEPSYGRGALGSRVRDGIDFFARNPNDLPTRLERHGFSYAVFESRSINGIVSVHRLQVVAGRLVRREDFSPVLGIADFAAANAGYLEQLSAKFEVLPLSCRGREQLVLRGQGGRDERGHDHPRSAVGLHWRRWA